MIPPQLPGGYVSMGACALIPPLWRRVIDQRLLDYYDGDITRVSRGHVEDPDPVADRVAWFVFVS